MLKILVFILLLVPVLAIGYLFFLGRASQQGQAPGLLDGKLAACPDRPNCVSSDATDSAHSIASLSYGNTKIKPEEAWLRLVEAVNELPGTTITKNTGEYLSAECSSKIFGFVDDLELHQRPDQAAIAIRSAARVGHSDLGANRKRVELLRENFEFGQ